MAQRGVFRKVGVIEESSPGITPSASLQLLNADTWQLQRPRNNVQPRPFSSDARPYPMRVAQEDGTLTAAMDLQYENMLLFQEGLFGNDRSAAVAVSASTISGNGTTGVISDSGNGLGAIQKMDRLYISGAGFAPNAAGWYGPVTAAAAGAITIPASQLQTFSAGSTVDIKTRRLVDGITLKTFSVEEQLRKLTNFYRAGVHFAVQQGTFSWNQGSLARESYNLIGKAPAKATATIGAGADTAAPTSGFMNAVQDFGTVYIAEAATTLIISRIELVLNRDLGPVYGIGSVGLQTIAIGGLEGTINMTVIMDDNAVGFLGNVENQDTLSLAWDVVDQQGNRMDFFTPATKANVGDPSGGAQDTVEMSNVSLSLHDPEKDSSSAYVSTDGNRHAAIYYVPAA